ncbi:MAG: hypothetical protein P8165_14720 [Deltaproteobacteria bacterium]|jgi:hypothetical protein
MAITVLDPTNEPVKTTFDMAPRPDRLDGLTLGLIDNSKKNSDYLIEKIAVMLKERHGIENGLCVRKPSPSHGIPQDAAAGLARQVDLVVAGIGD